MRKPCACRCRKRDPREIRLTGGEPLVRRDLPELVRQLRHIEKLSSLSLTTNGILFKQQVVRANRSMSMIGG
jgi:molybdenum cofactor biosynthesis enzyme MoaA